MFNQGKKGRKVGRDRQGRFNQGKMGDGGEG